MKRDKNTLIKFWSDANEYQSIDPLCFDIKEYAEEWMDKLKCCSCSEPLHVDEHEICYKCDMFSSM